MPDRDLAMELVLSQFPEYAGRLRNGEYIQIYEDKRLPSAEDKLERFGGVDTLRSKLSFAWEQGRFAPYILQACRDGIMVPLEIIRFVEAIVVPHRLDPAGLIYTIDYTNRHGEGDAFRQVEGVTYLQPIRGRYIVSERSGFATTQEGIRQLASWPKRRRNPLLRLNWGGNQIALEIKDHLQPPDNFEPRG